MKTKRQEKILQLISAHEIETQEQLLEELKAEGFQTTQATISRDIKQLRIIKELGPVRHVPLQRVDQTRRAYLFCEAGHDLPSVRHQRRARAEHDRHQDHAWACVRRMLGH